MPQHSVATVARQNEFGSNLWSWVSSASNPASSRSSSPPPIIIFPQFKFATQYGFIQKGSSFVPNPTGPVQVLLLQSRRTVGGGFSWPAGGSKSPLLYLWLDCVCDTPGVKRHHAKPSESEGFVSCADQLEIHRE
jgi:hypothetical protein